MNNEVLKGQWKELKGRIREWWGDLTDDEVEKSRWRSREARGGVAEKVWLCQGQGEERDRWRHRRIQQLDAFPRGALKSGAPAPTGNRARALSCGSARQLSCASA